MRVRFWILSIAIASLLASCASTPKPIPVSGSAADVSQLAGEWSGEYHGAGGGRSGLISFKLSAGADSASGDVLMFPRQRTDPPPTAATTEQHGTPSPNPPQGLTIRFVSAAQGKVSGRLDPYTDPECSCEVTTVFEGRIQGDVISGHYTVRREGASPLSGDWKVARKK
jgi:hypothetical protein